MASSLFALLDDIATMLDDISLLTQMAAKKTTGVLGDDLALNAEQVSGVSAQRELPVVWAVARGSMRNKAILVPAALLLSEFLPWLIVPLLLAGGTYLCFEGIEKVLHKLMHPKPDRESRKAELMAAMADPAVDLLTLEREKVKGAIRTDFILSAEIIVITLGVVAEAALLPRFGTLALVAFLMTVGVYGLVAGIVKIDDLGLWLQRRPRDASMRAFKHRVGTALVRGAPMLMRFLTVAGTTAMFLVGGGILSHNWDLLHHASEHAVHVVEGLPTVGHALAVVTPLLCDLGYGLVLGLVALVIVMPISKLFGGKAAH